MRALFIFQLALWFGAVTAARGDDEKALLAAIRAHPDEDTPRLAYADWLDEHDRPLRAEFIRLQIEIARMDSKDPKYGEKRARERLLLAETSATDVPEEFRSGGPPATRYTLAQKYPQGVVNETIFSILQDIERHPAADYHRQRLATAFEELHVKEPDKSWNHVAELIRFDLAPRKTGSMESRMEAIRKALPPGLIDPSFLTMPRPRILPVYSRGFLEELAVHVSTDLGPDPFQNVPHLRRVAIFNHGHAGDVSSIFLRLMRSDVAKQIEQLHFEQPILPSQAPQVAAAFDRLTTLTLSPHTISTYGLRALLETPLATRLTTLEADPVPIADDDGIVRQAFLDLSKCDPKLKFVSPGLYRYLPPSMSATVKATAGDACFEMMAVFANAR